MLPDGAAGERWLAVRHAAVRASLDINEPRRGVGVSIFILRDVSDAQRLVREREKLRREQALAEMSAVLAHEIRNPLGSLELFAGCWPGRGSARSARQWVEHLQAGMRTLAATVNNVLHFHSLPAPGALPPIWASCSTGRADFWCRWRARRGSSCACATAAPECSSPPTGIAWSRCC
jgi:signal transduction histidine kinase